MSLPNYDSWRLDNGEPYEPRSRYDSDKSADEREDDDEDHSDDCED